MYSVIPFIPVDKTCVRMMVVIKVIILLMEMFVVFIYLWLSTGVSQLKTAKEVAAKNVFI